MCQNKLDQLKSFIFKNKHEMFSYLEERKHPNTLQEVEPDIVKQLVTELIPVIPVCHCNPEVPLHAEYDKVHYEIAQAIIESFWCGCLPQMKENRNGYHQGTTSLIRAIIQSSFEIGQTDAPEEEQRRQSENN